MLSFHGKMRRPNRYVWLWQYIENKKKTMSLQVRCSPLSSRLWTKNPGKRVLPFTSFYRLKASMTVEAAFVLPLFISLAAALMMPMRMLDTQRKLQTTVESVCEDLSVYAYVAEEINALDKGDVEQIEAEIRREGGSDEDEGNLGMEIVHGAEIVSDAAAGVWLQRRIRDCTELAQVKYVDVPDEGGNIVLEVQYQETMPVFSRLLNPLSIEVSAKRRVWTGLPGKLTSEKSGVVSGENAVEMVYVGSNMGRYHKIRDCHYISNEYQAVSVSEAKKMRDADGHRFQACSSCEDEIDPNGTVYVTAGGRHYHGAMDCKAMVSYVRKVPLSEVLYLGACSYCGGY